VRRKQGRERRNQFRLSDGSLAGLGRLTLFILVEARSDYQLVMSE